MIEHTNSALEKTRNDVFILVGKCLLNLQLYERMLKRLLPHFEFSSDGPTLEQQQGKLSKMMMGSLVGQLMDKAYESETKPKQRHPSADSTRFTTRFSIKTDAIEVERIRNELADLVAKRNFLIHHFRDDYDLQSEGNCLDAINYLDSLNAQAKRSFLHIQDIAERIDQSRQWLAEYLASAEGREFLDQMLGAPENPDCANGENLNADSR